MGVFPNQELFLRIPVYLAMFTYSPVNRCGGIFFSSQISVWGGGKQLRPWRLTGLNSTPPRDAYGNAWGRVEYSFSLFDSAPPTEEPICCEPALSVKDKHTTKHNTTQTCFLCFHSSVLSPPRCSFLYFLLTCNWKLTGKKTTTCWCAWSVFSEGETGAFGGLSSPTNSNLSHSDNKGFFFTHFSSLGFAISIRKRPCSWHANCRKK